MPDATRWVLIVHGGAKTIDAALHARNRQGCIGVAHNSDHFALAAS